MWSVYLYALKSTLSVSLLKTHKFKQFWFIWHGSKFCCFFFSPLFSQWFEQGCVRLEKKVRSCISMHQWELSKIWMKMCWQLWVCLNVAKPLSKFDKIIPTHILIETISCFLSVKLFVDNDYVNFFRTLIVAYLIMN